MGFLDTFRKSDLPRDIEGDGLVLRFPTLENYESWALVRRQSRRFLEPWEPLWPADDLSLPAFRNRIRRYREMALADQCYPYFIFSNADALIGAVTLNNVRRGVAQMATVGYWVAESQARQGHMSRALAALVPFAFNTLNLHRLEAACLPRNEASIRLLEKSGFEREGYAKAYLKIAGVWEDHILFGRRDT